MSKKRKSFFGANVATDAKKRREKGASYGYLNIPKGVSLFKERAGRFTVDVIPYIVSSDYHPDMDPNSEVSIQKGDPWYKRPYWVHRVGPKNETVVCPKSIGKKCPICEQRQEQFQNGMDSEDVIPKAQLKNLYLVIPIDDKEFDEELHLWDISNGNFQSELDDELAENPENGIFPDPVDGLSLSLRFSEESFNKNKFFRASRVDFEERDEEYDEDIVDDSPNLDEVLTVLSYKQLEALLLGIDDEDDQEDESEEEEIKDKAPKQRRKKKKIVEEESEEDEKPKRRKKKKADFEEPEELEDQMAREADKAEKAKSKKKKRGSSKKAKKENECPEDHEFGKDWDDFDDCDDCDLFDACAEANEQLEE